MIKKLQVIVREVYESEESDEVISHQKTGEEIESWDFKKLSEEDQSKYTYKKRLNGKVKLEVSEGDPIFGQIFYEDDLNIKDLILHLNRTK